MSADTLDGLRLAQANAVMPHVGALLDAWERMPNDVKQEVEIASPAFVAAVRRINDAAEGGPASPTNCAPCQAGDHSAHDPQDGCPNDNAFNADCVCTERT